MSLDSGRNVLEALRSRGVDAFAVDGIPALASALAAGGIARVFNILHGHNGGGEDGIVQGLMDAFGVPYTGSDVLGSALSMDKIRTKQVWLSLGLPTPQYRKVDASNVHALAAELGLPVVVKPANEGSSVGISRVTDEAGLDEAVALAARYDGQLLMEQMVVGDELTVAILGDVALPSIRIVPKASGTTTTPSTSPRIPSTCARAWKAMPRTRSAASRWPRSAPPAAVAGAAWT